MTPSTGTLLELQQLRRRVAELEEQLDLPAGTSEKDLLAAFLKTSVAAICILDPSGQIVYANRSAEGILALERSDIVKLRYNTPEWRSTALDGGPWQDEQQPFVRVMQTRAPVYDIRHAIEWPDGRRKLLSVNGAPITNDAGEIANAVFSVTDITQTVENERRMRFTQEELRSLIETTPSYIFNVGPDRRIRFINRTVPWLDKEEVLGTCVDEFVYEEDRERYLAALGRVFRTGEMQEVEIRSFRDKGDLGVFLSRMGPVLRNGKVVSATIIGTDITDLKEAERALWESQDRLHRAQKMESIGRLAGGVAHDFNNLLTAVLGFADLAQDQPDLPPRAARLIGEVCSSAERGASLVRRLMAFASKQVVQPRVVDLNDVVRRAESLLRRLITEHVELDVELEAAELPVKVDPSHFEQVLINLAINARDAMPDGGQLMIASRLRPPSNAQNTEPGDWVEVSVTDTGAGIEPEVLERIFEPFFTTKPQGEGTGLGLATCFGIVQQVDGRIEVESRVGKGTRFRVLLPRVDEATEPLSEPSSGEAISAGRERVLLVEDDDAVRNVAESTLREAGYELLVAANGVEAMQVYESAGESIDLLVTDVVMPRMGGVELAGRLRELQPQVLVLLASGHAGDAIDPKTLRTDEMHFIQKPFSPIDLTERIRKILDAARF